VEVSTASKRAARPVDDLAPEERRRLERAYQRLRDAISKYQPFEARELEPGDDTPAQDGDAMAAAQAEVQEAEAALWRVRQELLGWERPQWGTSAALVSDWFSDEDRIYDDRP
jgi:hypothetical protein